MTKENAVPEVRSVTGFMCPFCHSFVAELEKAEACRDACADAANAAQAQAGDSVRLTRANDDAVYRVISVVVSRRSDKERAISYVVMRLGDASKFVVPAHAIKEVLGCVEMVRKVG